MLTAGTLRGAARGARAAGPRQLRNLEEGKRQADVSSGAQA